jgi:hypothetical protein
MNYYEVTRETDKSTGKWQMADYQTRIGVVTACERQSQQRSC